MQDAKPACAPRSVLVGVRRVFFYLGRAEHTLSPERLLARLRWLRFFEQIFCVVKWKLLPGLGQRGSACKLTRAAARYAATQRGSEA